jgi:hypothetical protein
MKGTLNVWLWELLLRIKNKKDQELLQLLRMKKNEEQLLMGSKREKQLFGMNKGKSYCCSRSIRFLRNILQVMQLKRSPTATY